MSLKLRDAFRVILVLYATVIVLTDAFKCVLNPYYSPVCGSDNQTYGNRDLLNCYNRQRPRNRHVRVIARRECNPLVCPSFSDLEGPWPDSYPVCANNGYTYGHIHQAHCLKDFYPSLGILHEGGCTLYEVRKILGRNLRSKSCGIQRKSFEINPICTRQNVTYANPYRALCEAPRAVREKVGGSCGCPFQRSCERAKEISNAIKLAPISERTKYIVCGSDWRTYRSKYHLECSRRYNRNLHMTHYGRCKKLEEPCPASLKFIKTATPVCGTDGRSYTTYEALICAQFRVTKDLRYLHAGACLTRT